MLSEARTRRFKLYRYIDDSGVSGTGVVAEGVKFSDGSAALRWCAPGRPQSTVFYADMAAVTAIHGHGGHTSVVWLDD